MSAYRRKERGAEILLESGWKVRKDGRKSVGNLGTSENEKKKKDRCVQGRNDAQEEGERNLAGKWMEMRKKWKKEEYRKYGKRRKENKFQG